MNKHGFTLMELLVYMAVVGIVVVLAGQVYSDSSKMRLRTQSMIKASEIAENVGSLIRDDVAQMGAKSAEDDDNSSAGSDAFLYKKKVMMNPDAAVPDSSSFNYTKVVSSTGANHGEHSHSDRLTFRRIKYDGKKFLSLEEVSWFVRDEILYRTCKTLEGDEKDPLCPKENPPEVVMAEGVSSFNMTPAIPGVLSSEYGAPAATGSYPRLLPSNTDSSIHEFRLVPRFGENEFYFAQTSPEEGGTSITISKFVANYDYETGEPINDGKKASQLFVAPANGFSGTWRDLCKEIPKLEKGVVYELSFDVPFVSEDDSRSFCPGKDHLSVGFRKIADGSKVSGLEDFMFYPPTTNTEKASRKFVFSVKEDVEKVCLAFTFSFYSPVASAGSVVISDLVLNRSESNNYKFVDDYDPSSNSFDKRNVKAFRLDLQVKQNGEAGAVSLVIPTPSNGTRI